MTRSSDWTGRVGAAWANEWLRTDRSLADLSGHLDRAIIAAAPATPFAVLDIGCGAGATSLALARHRPDACIMGVDLSAELVSVAGSRSAGVANLSFVVADAGSFVKSGALFDMFVSRHGVMFFDDPVASLASLHAAAAPGARLVFSCFRSVEENVWACELLAAVEARRGTPGNPPPPGPFAFADPAHVSRILTAAGWRVAAARAVDFAYRLGGGEDPVADALDFAQHIGPAAGPLREATAEHRPRMLDRVRATLERRCVRDTIDFPAAAWIWSATA